MAKKLTNFDRMWKKYPNPRQGSEVAKATIGGNVDADWIINTCVIRVSRSFNYSDHPIPNNFRGMETISGGDGLRYAFRVKEFHKYLKSVYGTPTLSHKNTRVGGSVPSRFKKRQGVISFVVKGWSDATGHFDLWNGKECVHSEYFNKASEVYLWEVPSSNSESELRPSRRQIRSLSGSVGKKGQNNPKDVKIVQKLLQKNGVDPKEYNGVCGPDTIDAIRTFQLKYLRRPDGRVDVNGRTWRELNRF